MMENPASTPFPPAAAPPGGGRVLRMRTDNDRINGSYPVWESAAQAAREGGGTVESALSAATQRSAAAPAGALAYADPAGASAAPREFGFGDLIDIVNPLQHIPLVNQVYRKLTGDTIRPIGRIVGGALYGGFAGAALGLADTVVQYETGKDAAGNMVALVTKGDRPAFRPHPPPGTPEQRLNDAAHQLAANAPPDLPGTTLAFADMKQGAAGAAAANAIAPAAGADMRPAPPSARFVSASYAANAAPYAANVPQPNYND
jgi:hypothetical protein